MRKYISFHIEDTEVFKRNLVLYSENFQYSAVYDSCNYYQHESVSKPNYHSFDFLAGVGHVDKVVGDFEDVQLYQAKHKDWLCGYWSYDLKNVLEKLSSTNHDGLNFAKTIFFRPRYIVTCKNNTCSVGYMPEYNSENEIEDLVSAIKNYGAGAALGVDLSFKARVSKQNYCEAVRTILEHIHKGDIYEMNYCMEFYAEKVAINPYRSYNTLVEISPTPFAAFLKVDDKFVMCASPERYLKKVGDKIVSQPIKGTAKRSADLGEDARLKQELASCVKERSENVMIADLVRNDLSRVAARGSVQVEELCGVYPFRQVFQMISTIVAQLDEGKQGMEAIKASFPAGSMTGAPKIRAMELIEKYEATQRGVYSGAVGYFTPDGDFDFNVVIRTLLYDATSRYLSFMVGSAITEKSIPEKEYDECLLKAKAILQLFNQDIITPND